MDQNTAKAITPNTCYITDRQFAERLGVSRVTIWRRAKNEPSFPKPVKLSPQCTRWRLSDVEDWDRQLV